MALSGSLSSAVARFSLADHELYGPSDLDYDNTNLESPYPPPVLGDAANKFHQHHRGGQHHQHHNRHSHRGGGGGGDRNDGQRRPPFQNREMHSRENAREEFLKNPLAGFESVDTTPPITAPSSADTTPSGSSASSSGGRKRPGISGLRQPPSTNSTTEASVPSTTTARPTFVHNDITKAALEKYKVQAAPTPQVLPAVVPKKRKPVSLELLEEPTPDQKKTKATTTTTTPTATPTPTTTATTTSYKDTLKMSTQALYKKDKEEKEKEKEKSSQKEGDVGSDRREKRIQKKRNEAEIGNDTSDDKKRKKKDKKDKKDKREKKKKVGVDDKSTKLASSSIGSSNHNKIRLKIGHT